jgi:hypothetical protein
MNPAAWTFVLLGAFAAVALIILSFVGQWRRRRALRYLARRLGLVYAKRDDALAQRLGFLSLLGGRGVIARNAASGTYEGRAVHVFDAEVGKRSFALNRTDPLRFTCLVLEHEGHFPELLITPRLPRWDVDLTLREDDVELESAEFAKAFRVWSRDRKFAYDICHPRMMEYLLTRRDQRVEIARNCLALRVERRRAGLLPVRDIPQRLKQLVEIRNLLSRYLFTDALGKPQCKV